MSSPSTETVGTRPEAVARASVVTNGRNHLAEALRTLERCAADAGVELLGADDESADVVLALGGDGTMLRALRGRLGSGTPVFGVNFGRVGFLTSAEGDNLAAVLPRLFAGEVKVVELTTLSARFEGGEETAVNDVVVTSARPGRMVELGWEVGGEHLGDYPCDGVICSTPSGSTAYNLSNGGPVMMWGLDAMAITFVAPHSLHARPVVVPRGYDLRIANRTRAGAVTVLVDGRGCTELAPGGSIEVGFGNEMSRLAHLPEVSFFTRYHQVFP